jgi:hypothetical protein
MKLLRSTAEGGAPGEFPGGARFIFTHADKGIITFTFPSEYRVAFYPFLKTLLTGMGFVQRRRTVVQVVTSCLGPHLPVYLSSTTFEFWGYQRSEATEYVIVFDDNSSESNVIDAYNPNASGNDPPRLLFSKDGLSDEVHSVTITNVQGIHNNTKYGQINGTCAGVLVRSIRSQR